MQLVLTPDTEWEKRAINAFEEKKVQAEIFGGAFYDCRGGWTRQRGYYGRDEERSLILRVDTNAPVVTAEEQP